MYKSKNRKKNATPLQKTCSTFGRKVLELKKINRQLQIAVTARKEQQRRDHNFIELFKEKYSGIFEVCLLEYEKKYGRDTKK